MAPTWQDEDLHQDGGRQGPIYDDDVGTSTTPDTNMSLLPTLLQDGDLLCPICNGHGHVMWDCQGGEEAEEADGVEETKPIPMSLSDEMVPIPCENESHLAHLSASESECLHHM